MILTGAVDDIWIQPDGKLIVVDYKSTSTVNTISLDDEYKQAYKRQMEIYQYLLRNKGFEVSDTGYFVYANGRTDLPSFNSKLEFNIELISYDGNAAWVDGAVILLHKILMSDNIPDSNTECKFCNYRNAVSKEEN